MGECPQVKLWAHALASDTTAPLTPEAHAALAEAGSRGWLASYGDDAEITGRATQAVRTFLGHDEAVVRFVGSGTAANAVALSLLCDSHQAVLCHREAHVERDEAGAPGFFRPGLRLVPCGGDEGRLDLEEAEACFANDRGVHSSQIHGVSVTQATELGTVYTLAQLARVRDFARRRGLRIHMDGARFANALVSLGCTAAELTWKAGVDVLCLGGTKNGTALSDVLVFFNPDDALKLDWRLKQSGHLPAKQRYLSAPWAGALEEGWFLRRAAHANRLAERLASGCARLGIPPALPRQANSVFLRLTEGQIRRLSEDGWHFYKFLEPDVHRLVVSWAVEGEVIERFLDSLAQGSGATR